MTMDHKGHSHGIPRGLMLQLVLQLSHISRCWKLISNPLEEHYVLNQSHLPKLGNQADIRTH